MNSPAFIIVLLVVAITVLLGAITTLIRPICNHLSAKLKHYVMIERRRRRFYSELKMLMQSA